MWLSSLFGISRSNPRRTRTVRRKPPSRRLTVEALEDRTVPTLFTVTSLADSGLGSLRDAIGLANTTVGADQIDFGVTGQIALTSGQLAITDALSIAGPGAANLTILGYNGSRIFNIDDGSGSFINVEMAGLTLTGGRLFSGDGGAIHNLETLNADAMVITENVAYRSGGGIYNGLGELTLTNSTISGNEAAHGFGGGIVGGGALTVTNCTVSDNFANYENGGGIENFGTIVLTGSVLSGNAALVAGGGLDNSGTATLTNCTLSGNSAVGGFGGGVYVGGPATLTNCTLSGNSAVDGGGIFVAAVDSFSAPGTATLNNTIVANSTSGGDVVNLGILTGSNNLIEDGSGLDGLAGTISGDPNLGPLQDNGGPTLTHALLAGSPAIDAGGNALVPAGLTTDQRGLNRFVGTVDIGAFESAVVADPNDPPVNTVPGAQATGEDVALVFSSANGNALAVSDPDVGSAVVQVTLSATHGTLTLGTTTGLTVSTGDGSGDASMTFTGTLAAINAALNGLAFAPTLNFNGTAILSITTNDLGNSGTGSPLSDTDSVSIAVLAPADQAANTTESVNDLVAAGTLSTGQGNALNTKLAKALEKLQQGHISAAINQLNAFINQVQSYLAQGILSAAEGNALIAAVNNLLWSIQH